MNCYTLTTWPRQADSEGGVTEQFASFAHAIERYRLRSSGFTNEDRKMIRPVFCFTTAHEGHRLKKNLGFPTVAILDFDTAGADENDNPVLASMKRVNTIMAASGLQYCLHTTFSHKLQKKPHAVKGHLDWSTHGAIPRVRVIVPLSRIPTNSNEFLAAHASLNALFEGSGLVCDHTAKEWSRSWSAPRVESDRFKLVLKTTGRAALDVPEASADAPTAARKAVDETEVRVWVRAGGAEYLMADQEVEVLLPEELGGKGEIEDITLHELWCRGMAYTISTWVARKSEWEPIYLPGGGHSIPKITGSLTGGDIKRCVFSFTGYTLGIWDGKHNRRYRYQPVAGAAFADQPSDAVTRLPFIIGEVMESVYANNDQAEYAFNPDGGLWQPTGVTRSSVGSYMGLWVRSFSDMIVGRKYKKDSENAETVAIKLGLRGDKFSVAVRACIRSGAADSMQPPGGVILMRDGVGGAYALERDGEQRDIVASDFAVGSRLIAVDYDPDATCPQFEKFIDEALREPNNAILAGSGDAQVELMYQYIGACLYAEAAKTKKALMVFGPSNTGKSVLLNVIEALFPKSSKLGVPLNSLLIDITHNSFGLDGFATALINVTHENDLSGFYKSAAAFKALVGESSLSAPVKSKSAISFVPRSGHVFGSNKLPSFSNDGDAVLGRLETLYFPRVVSEDERDVSINDRMKSELPGIMNECIRAYRRLVDNRYRLPKGSPYIKEEIAAECTSTLDEFIFTSYEYDISGRVSSADVSTAYNSYVSGGTFGGGLSSKDQVSTMVVGKTLAAWVRSKNWPKGGKTKAGGKTRFHLRRVKVDSPQSSQ